MGLLQCKVDQNDGKEPLNIDRCSHEYRQAQGWVRDLFDDKRNLDDRKKKKTRFPKVPYSVSLLLFIRSNAYLMVEFQKHPSFFPWWWSAVTISLLGHSCFCLIYRVRALPISLFSSISFFLPNTRVWCHVFIIIVLSSSFPF
jgi:hypothetical protein